MFQVTILFIYFAPNRRLNYNELSGPIPATFGKLKHVYHL